MKAPFSLFLALRYLKPKRTFVSVITVISVMGVTLGIAVLIIVISVMSGFDRQFQRAILGFEPHLRVEGQNLSDWREIIPKIVKIPGVVSASPYVQGPVLAEGPSFTGEGSRVSQAMVRGVSVGQDAQLVEFQKLVKGTTDMASDEIIVGRTLAGDLGVGLGDTITIYAPGNISELLTKIRQEAEEPGAKSPTLAELKAAGGFVIPVPMKIVGIFDSGTNSYDANFIIMPLHNAQELYALKDVVHGIAVMTNNPYDVGSIEKAIDYQINTRATGPIWTISWYDNNRTRLEAIHTERIVMFFILMFLVVIAAFSVMNTQITVTVQKTREIGILKALGASPAQIIWVFLSQGMFVGVLGNVSGLALGMTILHFRNDFRIWLYEKFGVTVFSPRIYDFNGIPAEVIPRDVAIICVSAFVICSIAAYIPALIASRLDPVKALRYE